jgi:hypothetical protein
MKISSKIGRLVLLSCTFLLVSCSINRNIEVSLAEPLMKESVQVDFLGIWSDQVSNYEEKTFDSYWEEEVILGNNDKAIIAFLPFEKSLMKKISPNDSIWRDWSRKDYDYMFVAVDLHYDKKNEAWKKIIKMESFSWFNFWSNRDLFIHISKKGLSIKNK